jgi:Protein of unknown function (DUF2971)
MLDYQDILAQGIARSSGADKSLERARVLKNSNFPAKIFRYRTLTNRALEEIKDGTIFLSSPRNFNDPFDCISTLLTHFDDEDLSYFNSNKYGNINITASVSADGFRRYLFNKMLSQARNTASIGIACFSTRNDSILMWSHYSKNHSGICLEYFTSGDSERNAIFPVSYFERPPLPFVKLDAAAKISHEMLSLGALVKAKDWDYENEWRYLKDGGADSRQPFKCPIRVYVGSLIDEKSDLYESLRTICGEKSIEIVRMGLDSSSFRIKPSDSAIRAFVNIDYGIFSMPFELKGDFITIAEENLTGKHDDYRKGNPLADLYMNPLNLNAEKIVSPRPGLPSTIVKRAGLPVRIYSPKTP